MKESYREDLASSSGLEPYAGDGNIAGVASARGNAGQPLSSEIITFVCRSCPDLEKATSSLPLFGKASTDTAEPENLCMRRHPKRENREILLVSILCGGVFTPKWNGQRTLTGGTADMNVDRKSDGPIVPAKRTNKTRTLAAESAEERGSPKGSMHQQALPRTQRRNGESIGWSVCGK